MKKALITAAALALVTVGAIAAYKLALAYKVADIISDEAAEDFRQQFMTGAYADYREVSAEDMLVFSGAYTGRIALHPQSVATQVVAGTNYKFICTDDNGMVVKVVVFKPLPGRGEPEVSVIEPVTAYDDIVNFVREGFGDRWQNMLPADKDLSQVYCYCSPAMGSARIDINHDGVVDLVLGESCDAGHTVYDIFTYDTESGGIIHLASGGERDRYYIDNDGAVFREGSNSAFDSFTKSYCLQGCHLVETKKALAEGNLMEIGFTTFMDEN